MDIQTAKQAYDCRIEIEKCLGQSASKDGDNWVWSCPFHSEKSVGGFHVYYNGYYCFSCGEKGDIFDWWAFWRNQSLSEVLRGEDVDPQLMAQRAAENAKRVEQELQQKIEDAQQALAELRKANAYLEYHNHVDRDYWHDAGVPDWWIDFWKLGSCDHFCAKTKTGLITTSTQTIPIFAPGWELQNIRHRLMGVLDGDKYRPERPGLPAVPFLADPDTGYDVDNIVVVEGEKKGMVAFITADNPKVQVIGIAGKQNVRHVSEILKDREPVVILDPDATQKDGSGKDAYDHIQSLVGKIRSVKLPFKLDDGIIKYGLDKEWMNNIIGSARVS